MDYSEVEIEIRGAAIFNHQSTVERCSTQLIDGHGRSLLVVTHICISVTRAAAVDSISSNRAGESAVVNFYPILEVPLFFREFTSGCN